MDPTMNPDVMQMLQALAGKMQSEGNLASPQLPPTDMGLPTSNQQQQQGLMGSAMGGGMSPDMMNALMQPAPGAPPPMTPPPNPMY